MWTKLLNKVVEILRSGQKTQKEISEAIKGKKDVRNRTLERMLNALEDANLIEKKEDGKYEWIKEYQGYTTLDEYQAKLNHAKVLLGTSIDKARAGEHRLATDFLIQCENSGYFLQHLESGYPDVHKLKEWWKEDNTKTEKAKNAFYKEIEKIASEKSLEIKKSIRDLQEEEKQVSSVIFNSIKRYCKLVVEEKLSERVKLRLKDEGVFDPIISERIAIDENIKEELEALIETSIHSENLKKLYKALVSIEGKESEDYSNLVGGVVKIIREVELGKPLEGSCDACRFSIGRKV